MKIINVYVRGTEMYPSDNHEMCIRDRAYGISRTSALDMAAYFGDMSTSMGLTQAKAAQMSKEIVGWIGDISSFKNVSLDVAKTAASAIWTGETESIKQLGVVMTEAL